MRLIDAEALENKLVKTMRYVPKNAVLDVACMVNRAPTVEAKPIVHAHWISEDEAEELGHFEWSYCCSNCKEIFWDCTESFAFSYCPCCGATMDEPFSQTHENGVKIPVISMEDVPKLVKEMEK